MADEKSAGSGTVAAEQKKKISKAKIFPPIVFVIVVVVLIIIKYAYKEKVSNTLLIAIGAIVGVICLIIVVFSFFAKFWEQRGQEKADSNIPKPITIGEAENQRERVFKSKKYAADIGTIFIEQTGSYGEDNKQMIWYSVFKARNKEMLYFYGLNLHFWETNYAVVILGRYAGEENYKQIYDKYKTQIDMALKRLPTDTERPANQRTIKTSNAILGTEQEIHEKSYDKESKVKKEEESLAKD